MSLGDLSKCYEHPDEDVRFHCEECNTLVCDDCVIGNHKTHNMMKLKEYGANQRQRVMSYPDNANGSDIPNINSLIEEAKSKNENFQLSIRSQKDAIKGKRKMLDTILDELEQELIDCFQKSEEDGQLLFDRFLQRQNEKKKKIMKIIEEIKAKGGEITDSDVAFHGKALEELANKDPFLDNIPVPPIPTYVFNEKIVSKEKIRHMIGYAESGTYSLAEDTQSESKPFVSSRQIIDTGKSPLTTIGYNYLQTYERLKQKKALQKFASFSLDSAVSHIVPKKSNKAWLISSYVYDVEFSLFTQNQPKIIGKPLTEPVNAACLGKDDALIIGFENQTSLKGIEIKTNVLKRQSVNWLSSIQVCSKDEVLMCISKSSTGDFEFLACIKSDLGYFLRRYQNAKSTDADVALDVLDIDNPVQICENKNGEVCILCSPENKSSWIVLLHKNELKFKYPLAEQDGKLVRFIGAGFLQDGVAIAVETGSKQIIIDIDGKFQQDDPLEKSPTCSVVDENFNIWIGFEDGSVRVYRYIKENPYTEVETTDKINVTQF